jgi:CheY-like chemotaxis protein
VPKVLVADDNSNIQKMVTLLLKDQGIEVTAVGNGEAAVRRLPDLLPDVVLADVFMPVRNGYEVCEFIKRDPRFSHIPVVLLLGAFDPLDETEAKRVGADGVLKKPFVPPDPLLTMIKGLLEKIAPESFVPAAIPAASETLHAEAKSAPRVAPLPAPLEEAAEVQEFPAMGREALDTIGAQEPGTVAPGTAEAPESDEPLMTSQRDSALGEPAFWHPLAPEEEAPAGSATESAAPGWGDNRDSSLRRDEFGGVQAMETQQATEPALELETESTDTSTEPLHVEPGKAPGLAESAEEWLETELAHPAPHAAPPPDDESSWNMEPPADTAPVPAPVNVIEFSSVAATHAEPEAHAPSADSEPLPPPAPTPEENQSEHAEPPKPEPEELPPLDALQNAVEQLGPAKTLDLSKAVSTQIQTAPAAKPADPELVEAVVNRVMAKLQPEVIESITREVLRPIVEALVRREVEKP